MWALSSRAAPCTMKSAGLAPEPVPLSQTQEYRECLYIRRCLWGHMSHQADHCLPFAHAPAGCTAGDGLLAVADNPDGRCICSQRSHAMEEPEVMCCPGVDEEEEVAWHPAQSGT